MNKSKICILSFLLFWTVSCTKPETPITNTSIAADTTAENQLKKLAVKLPKDVPNVEFYTNTDPRTENGVVISIFPDKKYFIQTESVPSESLKGKIENLVTRQNTPAQINADANLEYGEIVPVLEVLASKEIVQKRDLDRISFLAEPPPTHSKYIALVEAYVPSNKASIKSNPTAKKLNVSLAKDGKIKFDNKEISLEDLRMTLYTVFRDNDALGIYLSQTNEPDRTVNLKVARSVSYEDFVKFIGELTDIKARIVLQFDNLES